MSKQRNLDTNNYEAWAIDFFDGTLSAQELERWTAFLSDHPDLADEVAEIADLTLTPAIQLHPDKESLKMPEGEDLLLITALEQKRPLADIRPELQAEYAHYQGTILEADLSLVFPNKEGLKKKATLIVPLWVQRTKAAAAVAMLAWILWPNPVVEQYQARTEEVALPPFEYIEEEMQLASEKQEVQFINETELESAEPPLIPKGDIIPAYAQEPIKAAEDHRSNTPKKESPSGRTEPSESLIVEAPELQQEPSEESHPEIDNTPEEISSETALASADPQSETKAVQRNVEEYSSALDLLKRATRDSEVFALENANKDGAYTSSSLKVGNFKLSLKRRKRKS